MIKRNGGKYEVRSEDGKKLLGTYDSEEAAKKRLREVHYFSKVKKTIK